MKQITFSILAMFMLFSKANAQCSLTATEQPTADTLQKGTNVFFGKFDLQNSNCDLKVDSIRMEVTGTAFCGYVTNLVFTKDNMPVGPTIPVMSYIQTVLVGQWMQPYTSDTFLMHGHLDANALTDTIRTYDIFITVFSHDTWGGPQIAELPLLQKRIVEGPTPNNISTVEEALIALYPNPATNFITLEGVTGEIVITYITGQPVMKKIVSQKENVDISHLASGMYILKSKDQVIKFTKK